MKLVLAVALMLGSSAVAQGTLTMTTNDQDVVANTARAVEATGVQLRGLDKLTGELTDLELQVGERGAVGRISVTPTDCRYPEDNASGEAYAFLMIADDERGTDLFDGWMIASSPALNALDHPRYDVWVIRCTTQ